MRFGDVIIVLAVIFVVMMIIIPLPSFLLDVLLTFNISLSLIILLTTMYIKESLDFSIFPSLLLLTTLLRLSLNISSTRLILRDAYAGKVIQTFGNFVVGGNPVIGFIIFIIIAIIQFIVITRGAERVAEVAARFTLDAMPGKQMAVDADLNAGLINDTEAKERRKKIQREADFYGAMDGASKFVKGDAIVGIIIIIVNIIGGLIVGVVMKGYDFSTAINTYTLLTVGDGLVTQIPALLISTATGIIVTRAASESNLGKDVYKQLLSQPIVLFIAAGLLVVLGFVPGLPKLANFLMAGLFAYVGYSLRQAKLQIEKEENIKSREPKTEDIKRPESVLSLLQVETIELEFGYNIIPLVDVNQGGDLSDRIVMIRRQCALELGIIVPMIRLRDNIQLKPGEYVIKIKGIEVARGELMVDHYLAMAPDGAMEKIEGIPTKEPAFGLPALWITERDRERAEMLGYTVVDPSSIIATHLSEIIKRHAHEILTRQDVQILIDNIKESHSALIDELIPKLMTIGEIQKVLVNLLKENISIRDLVTILETLADYSRITKDIDLLTEYVRQSLCRYISKKYAPNGRMDVITLDSSLEKLLSESIHTSEHGSYIALEPSITQKIFNNLSKEVERIVGLGIQPIVLTAPLTRLYFKRLTSQLIPDLVVLSYNEILPSIEVHARGIVKI